MIDTLPRDLHTHIATFMEPLDLYMCKQTCRTLAHIDRGHPLRDTSLSMVGKQFEMYEVCAICYRKVGKKWKHYYHGMFLHDDCMEDVRTTLYKSDGYIWVYKISSKEIGTYKSVINPWNPALWDFQDNAIVGHKIDFSDLIDFFNSLRVERYVRKHYRREIVVGTKKVDVLWSFFETNRVSGVSGREAMAIIDRYAEELVAGFTRLELMFKKHSKNPFGSFDHFVDHRYYRWNLSDEGIKEKIKFYDMDRITREIRTFSREILANFLEQCDCRLCKMFFRMDYYINSSYHRSAMSQLYEKIYEGDVMKGLRALKKFLKHFLSHARNIVHEQKVQFIAGMDRYRRRAPNFCYWDLVNRKLSTKKLRRKIESYLMKYTKKLALSDSE